MAKVVRIRKARGHVVQDCDVYIGNEINNTHWELKRSDWANPYWGSSIKYEAHVRADETLMRGLEDGELDGLDLSCWCPPNNCQGDILVKIINEFQAKRAYFYNPVAETLS